MRINFSDFLKRMKEGLAQVYLRISPFLLKLKETSWGKKLKASFNINNFSSSSVKLKKIKFDKESLLHFYDKLKYYFFKVTYFIKQVLEKTKWGRDFLAYIKENSPLEIFFLPERRGSVHKIFIYCFVASVAYFFGKDIALLISPDDDGTEINSPVVVVGSMTSKQDYDRVSLSNIFSTQAEIVDDGTASFKKENKNIICLKAQHETRLPLKLVTTIVLQNSSKSLVAIQTTKGKTESYRIGDKVDESLRIDKIEKLKIYFKNLKTLECEYLAGKDLFASDRSFSVVSPEEGRKLLANKKMEGIENNGNNFLISRKIMNKKMEEIDKILTQARAIQVNNSDGSLAFIITEIEPGSVYSYLGIENNDRITEISGKKIKGLNEIMNLFAGIQELDHLELTVIKEDGNERTLNYSFSK